MFTSQRPRFFLWPLLLLLLLAACAPAPTPAPSPVPPTAEEAAVVDHTLELVIERDPDVPPLPFPDNLDPAQCGIPIQWGNVNNQAWLTGIYDGEMVQPEVLLYNSHLRQHVTARAPHGAEVRIVLFQNNPALNYYMVEVLDEGGDKVGEGWVPAPFLSFDPLS